VTHRERVQTALLHETPDRCPMQVSFTPEFAARLREDLGLDVISAHNPHGGGNTYELERAIDSDLLLTSVGWANSYYRQEGDYTDEWGIGWRSVRYDTKFGSGRYTEIVHHPLAGDSAVVSYRPPDPGRPALYREAELALENFKREYWIVGVTVTTIFECAWALRGYERLLMDLVEKPDLADEILFIPYRYHLTAARKLARMGCDMIWIGDDFGGQKSMLISPSLWRRVFKPKVAEFIRTVKSENPEITVAYHSDGNIEPIITDLIEIGLDVLNPVQPGSMDPAALKLRYGKNLCFWGSIDEQHTLPFGTPEEVRNEVVERIVTLGNKGGLIAGPTHHVQLDTPMENFNSMVDTIRTTQYQDL
jgi:uroporphyrinogen decarboxylase